MNYAAVVYRIVNELQSIDLRKFMGSNVRNPKKWMRATRVAALLLAAALVAVGGWMFLRPSRSASGTSLGQLGAGVAPHDLNLLVITLDTTRADRLGAYGYATAQTPVLDRLAREGVLFEQASTSAPITLPAHSTLFTGRFPPAHGVRDNGGFYLDPAQLTLAEMLREREVRTGAFVAAYVLDAKWGLDQGFDTYVDNFDLSKYRGISLGDIQRPANEVVDEALQWLDGARGGRFFGWLHLYDPHTPYEPPEPYRTRFRGRPYDGEIAFTDSQIGRVVEYLERHALLDRTVVVVAGDHGESLGDHGEEAHGFFIYESVVRVPLIVRAPYASMRGRRVADPVRTVDVLPTALDLLGIPAPPTVEGRSLAPLMTGDARELELEAYAEATYPLHHFGWSDLRALRSGRFKLIAAPRPELYDLQNDPGETQNLFETRRPLGDSMLARLQEMERAMKTEGVSAEPTPEIDPDARERLAALGYVGTFVATTAAPDRASLPDPKDKVHLFNLMTNARELSKGEDRFTRVIRMLTQVVEEDPKVIDAWFMLGNEHVRAERPAEAIEYFKRALALKPDYDIAVVNMANAYRRLGKDDEALVGYRRYLELDPRNPQVRYQLAQILIDRGQYAAARAELEAALAQEPKLAAARNALGVIALHEGNLSRAEQEIREAIRQRPDVRLAHFNLAVIAETRGDLVSAERQYIRELELHDRSFKAWFNLGRLYERRGDRRRQIEALTGAIEANPDFAEGYFYLAKAHLDAGRDLRQALDIARKGLSLAPDSPYAPLGHYVAADIYNRLGQPDRARREAALGRRLEARTRAPRSN
jgi:arylsulfatase A-like enzyme/Tfp pilus assembly protein PilF